MTQILLMKRCDDVTKYHCHAVTTSEIVKGYLVVEYDKGMLAFWGTAKECRKFYALQFNTNIATSNNIEL